MVVLQRIDPRRRHIWISAKVARGAEVGAGVPSFMPTIVVVMVDGVLNREVRVEQVSVQKAIIVGIKPVRLYVSAAAL